jgi:hypothetical protein
MTCCVRTVQERVAIYASICGEAGEIFLILPIGQSLHAFPLTVEPCGLIDCMSYATLRRRNQSNYIAPSNELRSLTSSIFATLFQVRISVDYLSVVVARSEPTSCCEGTRHYTNQNRQLPSFRSIEANATSHNDLNHGKIKAAQRLIVILVISVSVVSNRRPLLNELNCQSCPAMLR